MAHIAACCFQRSQHPICRARDAWTSKLRISTCCKGRQQSSTPFQVSETWRTLSTGPLRTAEQQANTPHTVHSHSRGQVKMQVRPAGAMSAEEEARCLAASHLAGLRLEA